MEYCNHCSIELTYVVQVFLIIWFFIMLGVAIFLLVNIYIADGGTSKPFQDALKAGTKGSKPYTLALLNAFWADSVWPIFYISSAILTPIALYIMQIPITVYNFTILFLISFMVTYFIFLFLCHHYIKFIKNQIAEYIEDNCPDDPVLNNINNDNKNDNKNDDNKNDDNKK